MDCRPVQPAVNEVNKTLAPKPSRVDLPIWRLRWIICIRPSLNWLIYGTRQFSKCPTFVSDLCQPIGVQDVNKIPDSSLTASSYQNSNHHPYYGRLHETRGAKSWSPRTKSDRNEYLQVDLGALHAVCAVATQGREGGVEWTTRYKVSVSRDRVSWSFYQENNKDKVLERFNKIFQYPPPSPAQNWLFGASEKQTNRCSKPMTEPITT